MNLNYIKKNTTSELSVQNMTIQHSRQSVLTSLSLQHSRQSVLTSLSPYLTVSPRISYFTIGTVYII